MAEVICRLYMIDHTATDIKLNVHVGACSTQTHAQKNNSISYMDTNLKNGLLLYCVFPLRKSEMCCWSTCSIHILHLLQGLSKEQCKHKLILFN